MQLDAVSTGIRPLPPLSLASTAPAASAPSKLGAAMPGGATTPAGELPPMSMDELMDLWGQKGTRYDFDADGTVGMGDLLIMLSRMSQPAPETAPPTKPAEPAMPSEPTGIAPPDLPILDAQGPLVPVGGTPPVPGDVEALLEDWGATDSKFDLDSSGTVDMQDLLELLSRLSGAPAPAAPDDPSSVDGLLDAWGTDNAQYDIDGDGVVGMQDLLQMLSGMSPPADPQAPDAPAPVATVDGLMAAWGSNDALHDLDGNGTVNMSDLLMLLSKQSGTPADGARVATAVVSPTASERVAELGQDVVDRLRLSGFVDHPPSNLNEILRGFDLSKFESQALYQFVMQQYPQGFGLDLVG